MKHYHIYFLFLKFVITLQVILVFLKKTTENSDTYVITDTVFKISIALYLFLFSILVDFPGIDFEDVLILRFSGVILLWDIEYNGILRIIRKYIPSLPKVPYLEK